MSTPETWKPTSDKKEEVIWRLNFTKGIFHKKIVNSLIITNYRVLSNNSGIWLKDIDDIIVTNHSRVSSGQYSGYSSGRYYRYGFGNSKSTSISIGDVVFLYQGKPYIIFRQISDPQGVVRLAKAARKRILDMIRVQQKLEPSRSLIQENKEVKPNVEQKKNKNTPAVVISNEQKKLPLNFKLSNTAQQKQGDQFLKGKEVKPKDEKEKEEQDNDYYYHDNMTLSPTTPKCIEAEQGEFEPPELEWQLANPMVSLELIDQWDYDIEITTADGIGEYDRLVIHPIEAGNYVELKKNKNKDYPSYIIPLKDIVDLKIKEQVVGHIRKRQDLLLDLTFNKNNSSYLSNKEKLDSNNIITLTINVEDKYIHEIVEKIQKLKAVDDNNSSRYWTKSYLTYSINSNQHLTTEIFLLAPFLAQGENTLWYDMITEDEKNHKRVNSIRTLTNFRVFEYDYNSHIGKAKSLSDIDEFKITNIFAAHKGVFKKGDVFGIFADTHDAITDNNIKRKNNATSKTIGDIAFVTKEGTFMAFNKVSNPEDIASLAKSLKEQYFSSDAKEETEKEVAIGEEDDTQIQIPKNNTTNATKHGLICPKCMDSNPKESTFCNKCGSKLVNACQKCGNINPKGSAFCNKCGFALE